MTADTKRKTKGVLYVRNIPADVKRKLKAKAKRNGVTIERVVASLIAEWIKPNGH